MELRVKLKEKRLLNMLLFCIDVDEKLSLLAWWETFKREHGDSRLCRTFKS